MRTVDPVMRLTAELYYGGYGTLPECRKKAIEELKNRPQDQRSLKDQLTDLIGIATMHRMYDAADFLKEQVKK